MNGWIFNMRAYVAVFYCLILFIAMSGCDRTHYLNQEQATSFLSKCPDFSKTGKAPVEQNAQCGNFEVLENPQDTTSAKIPLNILLLPAVNPVPEKDPLFIIAGGPGQSAVVVAESVHSIFNDVRKNRDIVFVDQRGTGKSNPLDCEVETEDSKQLPELEQEAFAKKALMTCIEKIKDHAAYYTTNYAVADLDAVRAALGYEKINLWGGSYGSRVVMEYMRRYPEHTRASVLDGVAPVAIALPWSMESDGLAALQALNQQCMAAPACALSYGDIVQKAQKVSAQLLAKPETIKISHPRTQEKVTVSLSALDFSSVVRLALYSRDLSSLLPRVINEADAGNYELFASLIYLAKAKSDMAGISYGMHYSVVCNEDYPLYKNKDATESNVFLNSLSVQKYAEVCSQWPRAHLPVDYWEPITSHLPVLMLSGAVDPVTPPRWAELVKKGLVNSTHVVIPGGHHITTQEGCIAQLMTAFIANGNANDLDVRCAQNIQPLAIHLPPAATVNVADKNNDRNADGKKD
ncbi:MAG: alpha/beta fold hydrolase [Moraxellaceae bacterium]|nr:MAG: alpha/beta fold hydrolase [Moraxellaceae bacterium]